MQKVQVRLPLEAIYFCMIIFWLIKIDYQNCSKFVQKWSEIIQHGLKRWFYAKRSRFTAVFHLSPLFFQFGQPWTGKNFWEMLVFKLKVIRKLKFCRKIEKFGHFWWKNRKFWSFLVKNHNGGPLWFLKKFFKKFGQKHKGVPLRFFFKIFPDGGGQLSGLPPPSLRACPHWIENLGILAHL